MALPVRAALTLLKLTAFRNYTSLTLALDGRPVVLTAANGAGKTNPLQAVLFPSPGRGPREAVSLLSPGRVLRRAQLDEVAQRPGNGAWAVAATVTNAAGSVDLGT